MISKDFFKGKRIAIIGLGPHGEMMDDIKFLIKSGATVSLYDLRSESRLRLYIADLRSVGLLSYVCGDIPADDLLDMDTIILSHEYDRESSFLSLAYKEGKNIEYPETFFFKYSPPVTVISIIGECGKSTVMSMLEPMLLSTFEKNDQKLFIIDPDDTYGTISHLKKIRSGDVILLRTTNLLAKEMFKMRISPHVSVFTGIPDKNSYVTTPFEILSYQTYNNFIVASDDVIDHIHQSGFQPKAKMLRTRLSMFPKNIEFHGRGIHDRENAVLAMQVATLFKVDLEDIETVLESWKPLKNRLELVKKVHGVDYFNDSASTGPYATEIALVELAKEKKIILILGGADLGLDYRELFSVLPRFVDRVILIPGSGTMKVRKTLIELGDMEIISTDSLESAVNKSFEIAKKGDTVLFSPGFGAGGLYDSRKSRGEAFVKLVKGLKTVK